MNERICRLRDEREVEYEKHIFLTCTRYVDFRVAHNIDVENLYSLLYYGHY